MAGIDGAETARSAPPAHPVVGDGSLVSEETGERGAGTSRPDGDGVDQTPGSVGVTNGSSEGTPYKFAEPHLRGDRAK